MSQRLSHGLAIASVNKDIRTLKGIFNRAINPRGYIVKGNNPFERIKQRKIAPKSPRYVSPTTFAKVIASTNTLWWKAFLMAAYTIAGRRDEILNLTWQNIDFKNKTVTFAPKRTSEKILQWEPKDHEKGLFRFLKR